MNIDGEWYRQRRPALPPNQCDLRLGPIFDVALGVGGHGFDLRGVEGGTGIAAALLAEPAEVGALHEGAADWAKVVHLDCIGGNKHTGRARSVELISTEVDRHVFADLEQGGPRRQGGLRSCRLKARTCKCWA
jgi:hypothetical protein